MPSITVSSTVRTKNLARFFSKFLPKELSVSEDPIGNPQITERGFLGFPKRVARFWSNEIDVYNPRWVNTILKAAEEYEKKYDETITIELQYNPASYK